jgi:hypothetical protein
MSLKDAIRSKSAGLVKRETVTLPQCGEQVQVRGLMAGEMRRAGESKRSVAVQVALSAEDPETGKPIWNPNDLNDLNAIDELHGVDLFTLLMASNRLSGADELGKLLSPPSENGSSSSLSSSPEPSGS